MKRAVIVVVALLVSTPVHAAGPAEYQPDLARIRARLAETSRTSVTDAVVVERPADSTQPVAIVRKPADSIWNGLLIGAAAGAGGGYLWARNECGSNDDECFVITAPVGVLVGAGIGALIGGLVDAFTR